MRSHFSRSAAFPEISFVSSDPASAQLTSNNTVFIPSSYTAGSFVWLYTYATNQPTPASFPSYVTPSGWTTVNSAQLLDLTNYYAIIQTHYKILSGSDPGSTIAIANGTSGRGAYMMCFKSQRPFRNATVYENNITFTSADPAQLSTTLLTTRSKPIIAIGHAGTGTAGTPTVTTNLVSADVRSDTNINARYTIFNGSSTLANVNIDQTDAGSFNSLSLQYFVLE